jgi:hypothetical protein
LHERSSYSARVEGCRFERAKWKRRILIEQPVRLTSGSSHTGKVHDGKVRSNKLEGSRVYYRGGNALVAVKLQITLRWLGRKEQQTMVPSVSREPVATERRLWRSVTIP